MSRVRKVVSTMPRQSDLELFTVGFIYILYIHIDSTLSIFMVSDANTSLFFPCRKKKIELTLKKRRTRTLKYSRTRTFQANLESWGRK